MKPNTLYMIGSVLIGIGVTFAYHAGRMEMQQEIKKKENKVWEDALTPDVLSEHRDPIPD